MTTALNIDQLVQDRGSDAYALEDVNDYPDKFTPRDRRMIIMQELRQAATAPREYWSFKNQDIMGYEKPTNDAFPSTNPYIKERDKVMALNIAKLIEDKVEDNGKLLVIVGKGHMG